MSQSYQLPFNCQLSKREKNFHFWVFSCPDVPMFDWDVDVKNGYHPDVAITYDSFDSIIAESDRILREHRLLAKLYQTHGGVHAWVLNKQASPKELERLMAKLRVDPFYLDHAVSRSSFNCRVSSKHREGETFIAKPLGLYGDTSQSPLPHNESVVALHDRLLEFFAVSDSISYWGARFLFELLS